MRISRPYIPLDVRVEVAERQFESVNSFQVPIYNDRNSLVFRRLIERKCWKAKISLHEQLNTFLRLMFGDDAKVELHHRPALINRRRKKSGDYDPAANDPNYLFYLTKQDHNIETRVRGEHGQHSDLGLRRKLKKIARNRDPKRRKQKITSRKTRY